MIRRSIPWTIQPPIGVGPNKKWIDRGLVALFDCRQARELISGDFATNRTSLIAPSTRGIAADFSGSANQQYAHRPAYAVLGPITIAALCDIDALTNYSPIITKMGTTTTNVPYELRVGAAATDSFINFARANTSVRDRRGASNRLTVPFKGLIAVTAPSGLIESAATLYVNNVPTVLSSNASGTGLGTDNGSKVWIGRRYDGATQLDGRIYYVPLFNAELSGAYLKELYDNPWDIYEPQQRNIYVSVAGGTITADANITQASNTSDSTATLIIAADASIISSGDAASSAAALLIAADASVTQSSDTVSGSSALTLSADAVITASGDTLSSTSVLSITADAPISQAGNTLTADSVVTITADCSATQAGNTVSATASLVADTITADASITQADNTTAAGGVLLIAAAASLTQTGNSLTSTATLASDTITANADITQAINTVTADGVISIGAGASITQDGDSITFDAALVLAAEASITQAGNTLTSSAGSNAWAGEPFNFASPITMTFNFASPI